MPGEPLLAKLNQPELVVEEEKKISDYEPVVEGRDEKEKYQPVVEERKEITEPVISKE